LEKVAKTVAKPKNAKISSSKLNMKDLKQIIFPPKNARASKNSPNYEILPNLATLCCTDHSLY
jgi:hypothetical protein